MLASMFIENQNQRPATEFEHGRKLSTGFLNSLKPEWVQSLRILKHSPDVFQTEH